MVADFNFAPPPLLHYISEDKLVNNDNELKIMEDKPEMPKTILKYDARLKIHVG